MENGTATMKQYVAEHRTSLMFAVLLIIGLLVYAPILPGNFLSDDHTYIAHLLEYGRKYVQGQDLDGWFFGYNGNSHLRPVIQWIWLFDFVVWNTSAAGYYLTNILLHVLNSFLVYLLIGQIVENRHAAVAGAILFAVHPSHPDSVAWISDRTDVLVTLFCLGSAVFFVTYRRRNRQVFLIVSAASFIVATLAKELAITLPVWILVYDLLFTFQKLRWRTLYAEAVFWLGVPTYVVFRRLMLGGLLGDRPPGIQQAGLDLFLQFYVQALGKPFLPDMSGPLLRVTLIALGFLLLLFWKNRGLWVGMAWVVGSLVPAAAAYMAARLVYMPSVGLAIAEAAILAQLANRKLARIGAAALFAIVAGGYLFSLFPRVSDFANAGSVAAAIPQELRRLHPSFPGNSSLYFIGVPIVQRNVDIYIGVFPFAIRNAYPNAPYFSAFAGDKFPILSNDIERAYFFEYRRRTIIEHPEVRAALLARQDCLRHSFSAYEWKSPGEMQQWEPWNELTDFEVREAALFTRALGADPFMGSPPMDVPSMAIGDIELEMRVLADHPALHGSVFWKVEGMQDFSPDLQAAFDVNADGEFHRYRIDLSKTGRLAVGDRIVQLRLDPVDAPAEIEIRSVSVQAHCGSLSNGTCSCGQ